MRYLSNLPVEEFAKGLAIGVLSWTKDETISLAQKITDREVAFIGDRETIEAFGKVRFKREWKYYKKYIKNKHFRILARLGLTLRVFEDNPDKIDFIRRKILDKYGVIGAHIAQFVQNEILWKYLTYLLQIEEDRISIIQNIERVLMTIDKFTLFVHRTTDIKKKIRIFDSRVKVTLPLILIFFGSGHSGKKAIKIVNALEKLNQNYKKTVYAEPIGNKKKKITIFFERKN